MDNQHRKIKGYRELSQEEVDQMNVVKEKAAEIGELVDRMTDFPGFDPRWTSIGKTHLQQGFMALTRAIAKPGFF